MRLDCFQVISVVSTIFRFTAVETRAFDFAVSPLYLMCVRSIPIISKSDYTDPAFHKEIRVEACGIGDAAWNTVAASPFARAVSVDTWEDLPELLDRLRAEPDSFLDHLQVKS